jgi:hypothetical protein
MVKGGMTVKELKDKLGARVWAVITVVMFFCLIRR